MRRLGSLAWIQCKAGWRIMLGVCALIWAPHLAWADRPVIDGLAIVQADGSLRLGGETVWLYGTEIPLLVRTCTSVVRPPRCGDRSVLVLANMIDGFVRCEIIRRRGSAYEGFCTQAGRDLFGPRDDIAAQLILRGWALAADDAPSRYRAYEAIAQSRDAGLWGNKIVNIR